MKEKDIAKRMAFKGYNWAIVFDKKDKLDNLYTQTQQQAINLMRTDYKDKKNYKIVDIDKVIGENKMKKSELRQIIREEIKILEDIDEYYSAEYYDKNGGHGDIGNWPKFEIAFKKAMNLYKKERKSGELGKDTGYIGVSGNGQKFAVIYIDKDYFQYSINVVFFDNSKHAKEYKTVAQKALKTGKPQIGTYSE